jgi:hypothetical protein
MVVHTCNSATWEADIKRIIVQGQPGQKKNYRDPMLTNKLDVMVHVCYMGGIGRGMVVHPSPRQKYGLGFGSNDRAPAWQCEVQVLIPPKKKKKTLYKWKGQ